jgi:hypothetical protein
MSHLPTPSDPDFATRVRASFERQGFMRSLGAELTRVQPGASHRDPQGSVSQPRATVFATRVNARPQAL